MTMSAELTKPVSMRSVSTRASNTLAESTPNAKSALTVPSASAKLDLLETHKPSVKNLAAIVMMNAHTTRHASTGNARTHASTSDVESMPSAQCAITRPNAPACHNTLEIRCASADHTSACKTQIVPPRWHAEMKSVLTHATVRKTPSAL